MIVTGDVVAQILLGEVSAANRLTPLLPNAAVKRIWDKNGTSNCPQIGKYTKPHNYFIPNVVTRS
jgi:hypothetical protein